MTSWRGPRDRGRSSRLQHRSWTDPRLLLGGLLVLGAAVLGSWLVAANDDRVGYWALAEDVRQGDPVAHDQLVETRALLDGDAARGVLRTDEELPAAVGDLRWSRDSAAGSLVGADALAPATRASATELPLSIATGAAPADLRRGQLVDVWVGPAPGEDPEQEAVRVLERVPVAATGAGARADGGLGAQTVLVDVGSGGVSGQLVARVSAGHVTLVRRT